MNRSGYEAQRMQQHIDNEGFGPEDEQGIVQSPQMLELLLEYRREHDADSCSPNGNPEPCGCSLCRRLDAILCRIGREDGGKIEGKGREYAIRSE